MRVLVTGSRNWDDQQTIHRWLRILKFNGYREMCHGGADGADQMSGRVASELCYDTIIVYPIPYWVGEDGKYDRAAGHKRNRYMFKHFQPDLVIAFRSSGKSNGTDNMIGYARSSGCPVLTVYER